MKAANIFILAIAALFSFGCATASFTQGKQFDTTKVSLIEKGKTTASQITDWFGQPFTKTVTGADGETWVYMHMQGQSKAQSYVFSVNVQTEGNMKKLDLLFTNGVVENFTFTDGGLPGTMQGGIGNK